MRTPPTVVTIGVFDGFHRGHASVVGAAGELAMATGSRLTVLTFDRHPRTVVSPQSVPPELASRALVEEAGLASLIIVLLGTIPVILVSKLTMKDI